MQLPKLRSTRMASVSLAAVVCLAAGAMVLLPSRPFARQAQSQPPPRSQSSDPQQPPPQRPVFRAGAIYVNVDVYPRMDGKIIDGLTAQDFEIFEDGKLQAVDRFETIKYSTITADAERRDPTSIADSLRQAADPHNRLFVIFLDRDHVGLFDDVRSASPMMRFLYRAVGPTDLFAVMLPGMVPSDLTFARRLESIEDSLRRNPYWSGSPSSKDLPRDASEEQLYKCYDRKTYLAVVEVYRWDLAFGSFETLVQYLGGLRDERKHVLLMTGPFLPPQGNASMARLLRGGVPQVGVGPGGKLGIGGTQERQGDAPVTACDAIVSRLSNIDFGRRFRELIDQARRHNVSISPVDTGGLRVARTESTDNLRTLAENTDGVAIVDTNNIEGPMRRLAQDNATFYLLGYYSSNPNADGRFRNIEVKVKRPGVRVTARRGYLAPTAEMRRAEEAAASRPASEPTAVDRELGRLGRIRSDAELHGYAITTATGLEVVTEIASSQIALGRWKPGGTVTVTVTPRAANATAVHATATIEAGTRGTVVHVPVEAASGPWRVVTRLTGADGAVDETFEVNAAAAAALVGAPLAFRGPVSLRATVRPVADFLYRRTERAHVEWRLLQPVDTREARLLNRQGEPVAIPVTINERADGDRTVLFVDLALSPLAASDYVLELTVTKGAVGERRLLVFRVVQ
jgi:VWFA-related protein